MASPGVSAPAAAAAMLLACCAGGSAVAQQAGETVRIENVSPAQMFELAAAAERNGRADDAEAIYRALAQDPDLEYRTEARFRLGMLLAKANRLREAAVSFRAILDEKPDAGRVRIELAAVLTRLGDLEAARRELRQAQAGQLPPEVAQAVNQFANALRSKKPFGASLELALVPDSNINRATDAQTLDTIIAPLQLSRDARERSGIGGRIAGQLYFRKRLGEHLALVPRASGQGEFYRQNQFDDYSGSALLGVEWSPGSERFTLSGGATWRWYGGDPYARTLTASLDWRHPLDKRTQLSAGLTVADTDYRRNDAQDGTIYDLRLGAEHAFSPRAGGSVELAGTRQQARDPGYANWAGGVTLLGWREIGRSTVFAQLGARRLEADARLFLYPKRRVDTLLSAGVGATFRAIQLGGFSPLVRVTYERNFSTVGIYDYRRVATTFGIVRAF